MKRWIIVALVVVLALSIMAVPAFAAGNRGFVDADGDGVCDNYVENSCRMRSGCGMAKGGNFVDADNDGVCDNMTNMGGGKGCCRMAG